MLLRVPLFVILFLFVSVFVLGQNNVKQSKRVIQRQLISAQTGWPLQYVQIKFVGSNYTFLSDPAIQTTTIPLGAIPTNRVL